MKLWKVLGYVFVLLAALVFCYGLTVGLMDALNPAAIWSMASSGTSVDFFSVLWSKIAIWIILGAALFIVGGIGLYAGRNPKRDKQSNDQRINELENSLATLAIRLDEIERKQNQSASNLSR
jgi:hypothetical protein